MEFGLHHTLPIYSGGLGVLAGDTMKSAGDLSLPVTGVGLLWNCGYTVQTIGADGSPVDAYPPTPRDALQPIDVEISVEVAGKEVALRGFRVTRHLSSALYLLEPVHARHQWITARLYGGGDEDRLAQEIILGVGGVRLLQALGIEPDVYHFNEGHAVFAGLELVSQRIAGGEGFADAVAGVRRSIVFTTHTPVKAGNEIHPLKLMRRMGACLDFTDDQLEELGGAPFSMTEAGLRLARNANGVSALHAETARDMWSHVDDGAEIIAITNGVHAPTWQDPRVRAALAADKEPATQDRELWDAHVRAKADLIEQIRDRAGVEVDADALLVGFARRAAGYKRGDLIFRDRERIEPLLDGGRLVLVFSGKAHPADETGRELVERLVTAARAWPGKVVFLENYDMELGAALTRGCDVWLNNPRRPMEASGTSGMKAAMNGVLNVSMLDGWWPEGCEHGVTGWQIGDGTENCVENGSDKGDERDAAAMYAVFEDEVLPRFEDDRDGWVRMMRASIAMSQWQFSSDRMVEDYFRLLYSA